MSGILRLESLTKGNTLKQGDKTPLKYRLFDADGEKLNIAGKSAKVRLVYPGFLTIGYKKDGLTVAQDDTVTFTIDKVIPAKLYHVEIIVDDKFIFPSRADESKFTIDNSSLGTETNIIEIVGVDAVVRKAVDLINEDPNLIIDEDKLVGDIIKNTGIGSIEEYHQQFNDVIKELSEDKDYHSLPEIAGARRGYNTLAESLGNLSVNMINKNLGKLDQTYMSEEFLQQMAGNTPINAVPADGSVTISKTTFIQESTNLFNTDTLNLGQSVVEATGELTPNPQYAVSDYIPIRGDHYIAVKVVGAGGISLYNQDFNHLETHRISSSVGQLVIPTGVTARWARVQTDMTHINQTQLNIGATLQPYESHYAKLDPLINPLVAYMANDGEEF